MKKLSIITLLTLSTTLMCSCGTSQSNIYKIGVLQIVKHDALDKAYEGFKEGLKSSGLVENKDYVLDYHVAGGNIADLNSYAKTLVASSNMTFGIATDSAKALKAAAIDKGIVNPILFTAVTDPVDAGLVETLENGKGFVTGTSDAQPVSAQIDLIKECIPSIEKIGFLYTQSESNSIAQINDAKRYLDDIGIGYVSQSVTGPSDISSAALQLASTDGVKAIYIPTDNNISANMNAVKESSSSKQVLVVCGEENMVKNGGHLTLSINYVELGKRTGEMAAQIIKGEKKAAELPVLVMKKEDCEYVICSENIAYSKLSVPQSIIAKSRDLSK